MKQGLRHRIVAILFWVGTTFVLISLLTYTPHDIPWESAPVNRPLRNGCGPVGAYLAYGLFQGFGWSAWFLPLLIAAWGWMRWQTMAVGLPLMRILGTAVFLLASSALWSVSAHELSLRLRRGGLLGVMASDWLVHYVGLVGVWLIGWCVALLALLAITDFLVLAWTRAGVMRLWGVGQAVWLERRARRLRAQAQASQRATATAPTARPAGPAMAPLPTAPPAPQQPRVIKTTPPKSAAPSRVSPVMRSAPRALPGSYQLPPIDLLNPPPPLSERKIQENLEANSRLLEETLRDFEIQVQVVEVEKGPVITRYELQTAPGTKVSRIASLSEEIALMMKAQSVRVAPISGKSRVGIEVPNTTSATVYLREVIESPAFQRATSKLMLAMGKTVSGEVMVTDLRECPHLLVAGTTGSGKTVCLNAMITGLLYAATPDDVRLLLIDPKMVEMAVFNGLPHLVAPVVTDAKKASAALGWAVGEMERRYRLLAEAGVRNIDGYNEKVRGDRLQVTGEHRDRDEDDTAAPAEPLPYLVLVIDELADLMVVAAQEVEGAIMRLAQLSRAVGIHLIMATQRPSVDVITGVIKANLPARVSFQVASKVDSRTVLDMVGADKLLGRGDLLFLNPGSSKPTRAQGCFLTDAEIERVVAHVTAQREIAYDGSILALQEKSAVTMRGERDEFFNEAKQVVLQTGQASTSMLQRRLRLGYTRAARLLDQLEEAGIVGPPRGAKPREILVEHPEGVAAHETVEDNA